MAERGIFKGLHGAYPRALYRAMRYQDADFSRPLIGIVNSWSEVNPGHFHLRQLADGRFSGATRGPRIGHVAPEAFVGGLIALVKDGDRIEIDIPNRGLELLVPEDELARRRADWKPHPPAVDGGFLELYNRIVSQANQGAVLKP